MSLSKSKTSQCLKDNASMNDVKFSYLTHFCDANQETIETAHKKLATPGLAPREKMNVTTPNEAMTRRGKNLT